MILTARELAYTFAGAVDALRGVDLAVREGDRLALLGANGAGKTTLLLHLNGSLRPRAGSILLDGAPVAYDRSFLKRWRQTVGLVLQDPDDQLFAGTVEEDVGFGPLNLGLPPPEVAARVGDALAALQITDLAARPVHMLSFGQKKRAAIAGVVAMRPRVLVLDEPTAGLDAQGVTDLLGLLAGLSAAGTTIIFSTHDVDLAYAWADAVCVLHAGRTVGSGAAAALLADRTLLAAAGLRVPVVLEVGCAARRLGLAAADAPLPRSHADLALLLARAGGGSADA